MKYKQIDKAVVELANYDSPNVEGKAVANCSSENEATEKPLWPIDAMIEKVKSSLRGKEDPPVAMLNAAKKANDNSEYFSGIFRPPMIAGMATGNADEDDEYDFWSSFNAFHSMTKDVKQPIYSMELQMAGDLSTIIVKFDTGQKQP